MVTAIACKKHNFKLHKTERITSGVVYIFKCYRCRAKRHISAWNFWHRTAWHPSYGKEEM